MRYLSTRGAEAVLDSNAPEFAEILLEGLAPDGGLYMPETWPPLDPPTGLSYQELTARVLAPFVDPDPIASDLPAICRRAYGGFSHPDIAPLVDLGDGGSLLELYWGPTLSFKDYALQVVARLFDATLSRLGRRSLVLGATSGDTGSAAIAACRGRDNIDIVILFPEGRVSDIQRRQMTTITDANVTTVAVEGTFDDCQALVKRAFVDPDLGLPLTAINSINWARVAVQASYYFWAASRLGEKGPVVFSVPTGNFGNVFAGYAAIRMGAPISGLIVANNRNHGLTDLVMNGAISIAAVESSLAPAMDIQIPSNLERYLFELCGRDGARVRQWQHDLLSRGHLQLTATEHASLREVMVAGWMEDDQVVEVMGRVYRETGLIMDPHTAIAWEVGQRLRPPESHLVTIATAHPAKFGPAVAQAIGREPDLPSELANLVDREERMLHMPNDYPTLFRLLRSA
ncbi:MAG: threonine synthase [Acidimicrobiia bacterium]|nr:threonine synthase [Acidimicrobiia bacterium]